MFHAKSILARSYAFRIRWTGPPTMRLLHGDRAAGGDDDFGGNDTILIVKNEASEALGKSVFSFRFGDVGQQFASVHSANLNSADAAAGRLPAVARRVRRSR